jgi:hypothetical protein
VATVAVIAGGTIGATHLLNHEPARHRHPASPSGAATASPIPSRVTPTPFVGQAAAPRLQAPRASRRQGHGGPGHVISNAHRGGEGPPSTQREPGGFAYLGVPREPSSSSVHELAHTAAQSGGGPFSP